jgi:hypothetical protein
MGKKTTKTNQTQTNSYGWQAPPPTADVSALREMKATVNPSIPFQYAKQREALQNSYQNPLGSHTTPAVREAATRATNQAMAQDEAQANAASQFDADNQNFLRQSAIAEMTSPRLVQTGGTATGTTTQSGGFWSGLLMNVIGNASQAGQAMMG